MARIAGIDIPTNKKIAISLTYICGIGKTTAKKITEDLKIDPQKKTASLTEEDLATITRYLEKELVVEGDLRRQTKSNIDRLKKIKCYRGTRHLKGLPVNGQKTKNNARTRKGKKKTATVRKA